MTKIINHPTIENYRKNKSVKNKNALIIQFLPFIKQTIRHYKFIDLIDFDDLVNSAVLEILENIDKYNYNDIIYLIKMQSLSGVRKMLNVKLGYPRNFGVKKISFETEKETNNLRDIYPDCINIEIEYNTTELYNAVINTVNMLNEKDYIIFVEYHFNNKSFEKISYIFGHSKMAINKHYRKKTLIDFKSNFKKIYGEYFSDVFI